MRINLPNSAHLANIDAFLRGFDPSEAERLDLTIHDRWVSVHPFALALTACVGAACRARGGVVSANVPAHRSIAYLIRMGLFDVLGIDPGRTITEHEASGRFIPLTQIRNAQDLKVAIKLIEPGCTRRRPRRSRAAAGAGEPERWADRR